MEPFQLRERSGKPALLTIERWEREIPGISAGFTTRIFGSGKDDPMALNLALHVGDDPLRVVENRIAVADALGVPFEAWTCGEQVHDCRVTAVTREGRGRGRLSREDAYPDTDGLITDVPGVWLVSFYADCVPLYFVDPVRRAVGLAHAGWKGTVLQIARKTVEALVETYGSDPADIRAAIGPSIGACCYEVDDRVADRAADCLTAIGADDPTRRSVCRPGEKPGKWMLDLQELNRQIMIKAGILPTSIEWSGWCTGCRTDLFYSHRKENGSTGRMASWIGLDLGGA